eukprot:6195656-Pleurochrysis_carterae.AAC.1
MALGSHRKCCFLTVSLSDLECVVILSIQSLHLQTALMVMLVNMANSYLKQNEGSREMKVTFCDLSFCVECSDQVHSFGQVQHARDARAEGAGDCAQEQSARQV